ncbi:bestrophin family protein [Mariniradius saccharolyticus]|nr:bestrophin family ion channel [Mariniradius saccharolyticus]
MYTKRNYSLWMTFRWSRKSFIRGMLYATAVTLLYKFTGWAIFTLPWEPISVIGIAVAFYLGFKNNSSYDRTWEARKAWGGIVNDSRTFATGILSLIDKGSHGDLEARKKRIIYRHLAWAIALKRLLRDTRKSWEHKYGPKDLFFVPQYAKIMEDGVAKELAPYLAADELECFIKVKNIPVQILKKQTEELAALKEEGLISDYKQVWFHQLIGNFYDNQGTCERIKNFPLPRQYASVALWMNYFFCALIPFGLLDIFEASNELWVWMTIPFSGLIIWIFFLMERIGDYSENPFESAYNDIPISAITRSIEIDLREMLKDENIPEPYPVENGFLM